MRPPYDKSFAEFLRFVKDTYAKAEFPEAYIPYIAHKATAGYAIEKYFPELVPEFVKREGKFAYAISEPDWKNSPLNLKSRLGENADGSYELSAQKSFILDADIGIFVVRFKDEFALAIVDTDYYRSSRVALDMPEATYRASADTMIQHYKTEFTATLKIVPYVALQKRDVLLLSRTIVFREQIAYAILAAAEAQKTGDMRAIASRVEMLCERAKEEPGQDDIAVAREILSAAIVRILDNPHAHGFWRWLGRLVKPV